MLQFILYASLISSSLAALSPQCSTVKAAYTAMGGTFSDIQGWGGDNCCQWDGIQCDKSSNVISVQWASKSLYGSIPKSLKDLKYLQILGLTSNGLNGSIPAELGKLSNLKKLWLGSCKIGSGNKLSGSIPAELGNLTNLEELQLGQNSLNGSIPASLGKLKKLKILALCYNKLTGAIPPELGNLSALNDFALGFNQLSGSIPAQLGNLAKLNYFYVDNNQLNGSIPADLGKLSKLISFYVPGNQLSGIIPSNMSKIKTLKYYSFQGANNKFTGGFMPYPISAFDSAQVKTMLSNPLAKRQAAGDAMTTTTLLSYCPLNNMSLVNANQILASCWAGLTYSCNGPSTATNCQNTWDVVFSNSIYNFTSKGCFPWKSTTTSTTCQNGFNDFKKWAYNNGGDSALLFISFSKTVVTSYLSNSTLAPCTSSQTPCIRPSIKG